ncbi:hypothetical protein [Hathewaya limosa]|uniref:Transposase n=1 Tax=Hathewaya limosa TaxID=1536 RepID=A0ABU0JX74_HATLI|nr:hypothetical protein [Hathewaya limosa]MDQ0480507.1 hypothetical protein [Hathewaya limosa]
MLNYMTVEDESEAWCISKRRVQVLCVSGRIDGVIKQVGDGYS